MRFDYNQPKDAETTSRAISDLSCHPLVVYHETQRNLNLIVRYIGKAN